MKHFFWTTLNIYSFFFGRPSFSRIYQVGINIFLHGLGYDNALNNATSGEKWFIKNKLAPTKPCVCVDIGANVGNYTKMLLTYTNAQVFAVEPAESSFKKLQQLMLRVTPVQVAIADFDGDATLFSDAEEDERATLDKNVREGKQEEKVQVQRFETFVQEQNISNIDFIKIDTEGYEREVLRGLGNVRPLFIQFEFNKHHLYRNSTLFDLTELLPEYEFYRLLPHGWLKIDPEKSVNNVFMFCNIVAKKRI